MSVEQLIHKPSQRDLEAISTVNYKVAQKAAAPDQSPFIGGEKLEKRPYKIGTSFAYDVSRELIERGYATRKLANPEALQFIQDLPNGSIIQLGLPNILSGKELISVYGLKVPYASTSGQLSADSLGLLVAADLRGYSSDKTLTRYPTDIAQVFATRVLPVFDPRQANKPDYTDMVNRNTQLALGAGLNRIYSKFGIHEIELTANNKDSPVDAIHDSATFQLLSLAARGQASSDPERLVHLNHFKGNKETNLFQLLQWEFAQSSPTVDEMVNATNFTYPFPLRLIELPLTGLPQGLPTEVQFTRHTVMAEQGGLYPLDLSPYAAVQDVRARGRAAMLDQNLVEDPMTGLNRATGGKDFLSLL